MGVEQQNHGAWERIRELAERLDSPHADKVFVAKGYTKADLRADLLASIPANPTEMPAGWSFELEPQKGYGIPRAVVRRA